METARWRQVKQIFQEARDKPESDRDGFIAAACGDDQRLRARVEALLAADVDANQFLASPTLGDAHAVERADTTELFDRLQRALAGRYSLERELGRGGMGIVYLARDVALDRPVAIKALPPRLAADPDYRTRFLREARTAAGLSHPNIVPIHLVEEHDGLVYFVMALVDGESLGDRVRRTGPLKPADAAKLVQEVAWALAYAHGRGVIHRDIKPDNILIDKGSGRALVTDFGIARVTSTATVSQQGEVLGTLAYMSPEQASAESVIDGRADLYSLGVTAFFALTGRLPFQSENPAALVAMHLAEPAPPVRSASSGVPARLAEAVDRCLAKDPAARFPSGEALADAIADSQAARREIAPSVREFLSAAKSGLAQVTGLLFLWWAVAMVAPRIATKAPGLMGSALDPLIFILVALTPIVLIRPFHAARGVIRAGLDERGVAEAAALLNSALDANVEYQLARVGRLGKGLSRLWARVFFLSLGTAALFGTVALPIGFYREGILLWAFLWLPLFVAVDALLLGLAIAPKRTVAAVTRGTPENAGLLRKLWAGPMGRWLFAVAGIGLRKAKALPVPESAPTEVLLGRAAGELFQQLPKQQRERLGDVREVIGGLERAAAALRVRRDALHQALVEAGRTVRSPRGAQLVAELEAARHAVEGRLGTAVAALENLRLDLLRLRAGVGHPDDLTASIEEARAVGEAVDLELAARREVESLTRESTPPLRTSESL